MQHKQFNMEEKVVSNRSSGVEMGTVDEGAMSSKSITDLQNLILQKKNEVGKQLLQSMTKQKNVDLEPIYMTLFLIVFIGGSIIIFALFLYYFLYVTCAAKTQTTQPYWTNSLYATTYNNPPLGLYTCQSFFSASITECAQLSQATKKPTSAPTVAPMPSAPSPPVSAPTIPVPKNTGFCLVPCVLPGFDCSTQYNKFNPSACSAAIAPDLATYYGNFTDFSCSIADPISCTTQTGPGGVKYNDVPAQITVVYLQCTSIVQSFLNAVTYTTYCQLCMSILFALFLIVKANGLSSLLSMSTWVLAMTAAEASPQESSEKDEKSDDKKDARSSKGSRTSFGLASPSARHSDL